MEKIYCEFTEEELDTLPTSVITNSVGWVEYDSDSKTWEVVTRGLGGFSCKSQEVAYTMANTEMILALLLKK